MITGCEPDSRAASMASPPSRGVISAATVKRSTHPVRGVAVVIGDGVALRELDARAQLARAAANADADRAATTADGGRHVWRSMQPAASWACWRDAAGAGALDFPCGELEHANVGVAGKEADRDRRPLQAGDLRAIVDSREASRRFSCARHPVGRDDVGHPAGGLHRLAWHKDFAVLIEVRGVAQHRIGDAGIERGQIGIAGWHRHDHAGGERAFQRIEPDAVRRAW